MAVTATPIFVQTPVLGIATLTSPTAITARTNITSAFPPTGTVGLTPASTNGKRVDFIRVQSKASSVAATLFIWMWDGTTAYIVDEIIIAAVTASNTVPAFKLDTVYTIPLAIPPTYRLAISVTVANDLTTFAFGGDY